nr:MAG: Large polyvalent-protein-associated domain 15 [Bacteriophage sp.]
MAALKEIAREYADEIRDGIGWLIVYRTGRSWHALTVWSDLSNNEWETDDINDALEALRLDPRAVALNGYYLGRFGDMTIDDIAAGIRWHYERGTNALAADDALTQARADIEAARQQAAEAGLPFSERLVEGPEDEPNLYAYDGSMTVADYEAAHRARDAHAALVEVVSDRYPNATEEAVERVAEAASSMKLSPEAVQRILNAFDRITEAIKALCEWAAQAIRTLADFFTETLDDFMLRRAPPKWRHYALHAKRARVRKKYRNRIRRAFFAALASEGGGSS